MIRAFIFDMDGTLVQTERLKAESYARAVREICERPVADDEVFDVYKRYVGRVRDEVVAELMEQFDLAPMLVGAMEEHDTDDPAEAFLQVRLGFYRELADDPDVIRASQWPHTVELFELARRVGCRVALATMSDRERVEWTIETLGWDDKFDLVLSRDDVAEGKPDPEVYELASALLGIAPDRCLVIEDSPAGVQAAVAAGMACIAVTTPFSRDAITAMPELPDRWKVQDPERLLETTRRLVLEHGGGTGLE